MPDPLLYLKATTLAAVASALLILVAAAFVRRESRLKIRWFDTLAAISLGAGLATGFYFLEVPIAWPPKNSLHRFLVVVLPAALLIELLASIHCVPRWLVWSFRVSLALSTPRILLHNSVYVDAAAGEWTVVQSMVVTGLSGTLLAIAWSLLGCLSKRSPSLTIPLAVCLAIQCAGMTVMMAGYLQGGSAAFPLFAAVVTTSIAIKLIGNRAALANVAVGVIGLFGIVFIGRYFGRISTPCALTLFLAPLLSWISELPLLRKSRPWIVGVIQIGLVAIPLVIVLLLAKQAFDREMAPLMLR